MKIKKIKYCYECPYFYQEKEWAGCFHSRAPKGAYEDGVPNSKYSSEPRPKWCPLRKGNHFLIKRDSDDKIISKIKLVLIS